VQQRLAALAESVGARECLPLPVATLRAGGHRHRARLMIRGRASSPKLGLFQEGTHRIADIPTCRVHHPIVNEVAAAARRAIRASGAQPYADRPQFGLLRALQVVIERASARAQIVAVANAEAPDSAAAFCDALAREAAPWLHSLWWNGNPERTNAILGSQWQRITGPESVREVFGGVGVHYPPDAFGQSHVALAERLGDRIAEWVPEGARIVEFYAGSGAIGLRLAPRARELVFNERAPGGLRGLELGLAERPPSERERVRVVAGAAGECAELARGAEVVIADPPRRGLDPELLRALCEAPPQRLLYASCGLDSFARELPELCAPGRLRLAALEIFDLFPFTAHVETLARFERA
jgi:tRNA/tmRNA/rRNA uracil-C5-methylase (TrmA/RlmC/RlmD family)